jgi:hypothetical protein
MAQADHTSALTASQQRKRAAIDAGIGLVITMLLWPFPIARAMLPPLVNVVLVLLTWDIVNIAYHVVCARVWRRTGATYLLGITLSSAGEAVEPLDDSRALRWGALAGALVLVNMVWSGASAIITNGSGAELRS